MSLVMFKNMEKNFSVFIFSLFFFYSNARKSHALFIEFLFPHDVFLQEKILPHNPLPSTPTQTKKEIPLKTSVHFSITITVYKHWTKFVTCSPSPRDCWGVSHSKYIVNMVFDYAEQNGYLKIWIRWLWKKNERGRGPRCPPIFWLLKKGTRTFHFCYNEPFWEILGPFGRYDDPWKKNKIKINKNKHAPVICLLAKNTKFHIL